MISGRAVLCILLLLSLLSSCQAAPQDAKPVTFIVGCSGRIDKVDLQTGRALKSVVLQQVAKNVPQGRNVDGCMAEHAAFDPVHSELIVVAPRDAAGQHQRLQLIWLAASTLLVTRQEMRDEFLPARVVVSGNHLLLGLGEPGDPKGRILKVEKDGVISQSWAGSGFAPDARMLGETTILTRAYNIQLGDGKAIAHEISVNGLAKRKELQAYASQGVMTASLADSAGSNALFLITTPGIQQPAALTVKLDGTDGATATPVLANQTLAGLHLSADGRKVLIQNGGKLAGYNGTKKLWEAEAPPATSRFICSAPAGRYVFAEGKSLEIVDSASRTTKPVALSQPPDPEAFCVAGNQR